MTRATLYAIGALCWWFMLTVALKADATGPAAVTGAFAGAMSMAALHRWARP